MCGWLVEQRCMRTAAGMEGQMVVGRAGWVTISSIEGLNECCSTMLFGKLVGLQLNGMIGMYVLQ